jgi:hypothetical protein
MNAESNRETPREKNLRQVDRYVSEFTFRLNEGDVNHHTLTRLGSLFDAAIGRRVTYKELIA